MRGWMAGIAASSVVVIVLSLVAARANADDDRPLELEIDTTSRFVFRGLPWSRGPVVQPYVAASRFGVTASLFGNVTILRENKGQSLSTIAPSIAKAWTILGVRATTAATTMSSARSPATTELSLACEKSFGVATVESTHAVDVGAHRGAYFGEAALTIELPFDDEASLSARASIGWGNAPYDRAWLGLDRASMQLVGADLALRRSVSDWLDVALHAEVTTLLSPARAHAAEPTLATLGFAFDVAL